MCLKSRRDSQQDEGSQPSVFLVSVLPGCSKDLRTSAMRPCHLPPPQREEGRGTRTVEVICDPWPPRCEQHREDSKDCAAQVFSSLKELSASLLGDLPIKDEKRASAICNYSLIQVRENV